SLFAFVLILVASPVLLADESAPSVVGDWEGELKVTGDVALKIVLHVKRDADGSLHVAFDSPDQGAKDLPIDAIEVKERAVRFSSKTLWLDFDGMLNEDGSAIDGKWKQGLVSLPLSLAKIDPAKAPATMEIPAKLAGAWEGTL